MSIPKESMKAILFVPELGMIAAIASVPELGMIAAITSVPEFKHANWKNVRSRIKHGKH